MVSHCFNNRFNWSHLSKLVQIVPRNQATNAFKPIHYFKSKPVFHVARHGTGQSSWAASEHVLHTYGMENSYAEDSRIRLAAELSSKRGYKSETQSNTNTRKTASPLSIWTGSSFNVGSQGVFLASQVVAATTCSVARMARVQLWMLSWGVRP